jgi:hypothetical protein
MPLRLLAASSPSAGDADRRSMVLARSHVSIAETSDYAAPGFLVLIGL